MNGLALRARHRGPSVAAGAVMLMAALPAWAYVSAEASTGAVSAVVAMALAAVVFPAQALLACAGLVPLGGPLGALLGAQAAPGLSEPLALAFLAGCGLRFLVSPSPVSAPARAALLPAGLLAAVVAASAIVELFGIQPAVADPAPFALAAARYLYTDFFRDQGTFDPIVNAVSLLAGLGLYAAAVLLVAHRRPLAHRLVAMAGCGAAGVAALNVTRLLTVWQRAGGSVESLVAHWRTIRASAAFGDPNAAGSFLAMGLLIVAGLALAGREESEGQGGGTRRLAGWPWLPVLPIVAAGLWLTGSRAALLVVAVAAAVLLPAGVRASRTVAAVGAGLVVLVLALSVPFAVERFRLPDTSARSVQQSFNFRVEMAKAAGRMIAERPVFGVGVGTFHAKSGPYLDGAFRAIVPRENAHNNFLQVFAELGVAGFIPFLALLLTPAVRVVRAVLGGRRPAVGLGAAAGVLAFVLSWLAGHPLLIFEVAASFWIVLGTVSALFAPPDAGDENEAPWRRSPMWAWLSAALVVALFVSVPVRGREAVPRTGFTSTALGLSAWETDERGERFRNLEGPRGQFYVRAGATSVRVPIRLAPATPAASWVEVELRVDGVAVSRSRVDGAGWRDAAVVLPRTPASRAFRTIEVVVLRASNRQASPGSGVQLGTPTITQ